MTSDPNGTPIALGVTGVMLEDMRRSLGGIPRPRIVASRPWSRWSHPYNATVASLNSEFKAILPTGQEIDSFEVVLTDAVQRKCERLTTRP